MRIAVDLDEVLAELIDGVLPYHNAKHKTDFKKSDFNIYEYWKIWGGTRDEALQEVYDFYETADFHAIKPVADAINALRELKKKHELFIVTGRPDAIAEATERWIGKHFPGIFTEIHFANQFSQTKNPQPKSYFCDKIKADVLIEDSVENAAECIAPGRKIIVIKRPWNINQTIPDGIYFVDGWDDVLKIIK